MKIEVIIEYTDIDIPESTWNKLAEQNQTNTIFQTYQWFSSWWSNCGSEYQLVLITGSEEGNIQCIAPLMIKLNKSGKKTLRFACDTNSDYCDFIISGNKYKILNDIFRWLYSSNIQFDNIELLNIPDYSTTSNCLENICLNENVLFRYETPSKSPTLLIQNHVDQVEKINSKYSVQRPVHKLEKNGEVNFSTVQLNNQEEIDYNLEQFYHQHISRYSHMDKPSLFTLEKYRNFYKALIKSMSDKEWVLFSVLKLDNNPIAYHFGFRYNNTLTWYKPSFDIQYSQFSPGATLLSYLIDYSLNENIQELDYTIGGEGYKNRYSNHVRYNSNLNIDGTLSGYYFSYFIKFFIRRVKNISNLFKNNKV